MQTDEQYEALQAVCRSYQNEVDYLRKKLNEMENGFKLYILECFEKDSIRLGVKYSIYLEMKDVIGTIEMFIERAKEMKPYISELMKNQKRRFIDD